MTETPFAYNTGTLTWGWDDEWKVFRAFNATHCFEVAPAGGMFRFRAFLGDEASDRAHASLIYESGRGAMRAAEKWAQEHTQKGDKP